MVKRRLLPLLAIMVGTASASQEGGIELSNGVLTYRDAAGQRSEIRVGGPCADLWVSPGGDMIAFIRVDKSEPDDVGGLRPFVEASTIFLAFRSNRFLPVPVAVDPPVIDGREWRVFLDPVLSPDGSTVYFLVPAAGTSWYLLGVSATGGRARRIGYVEAYCVLWGGDDPGSILAMARYTPPAAGAIDHRFERYDAAGREQVVGTGYFPNDFGGLVRSWERKHGGTCQSNLN